MKKVKDATVEELINDLTHWEDYDMCIVMNSTEDGGIHLEQYDSWRSYVIGKTLKEALIAYGMKTWRKGMFPTGDPDEDAVALDWREYD